MVDKRAAAALTGGVGLLERAISYTLGSLLLVTPEAMGRPTPCDGWDLRALLAHMNDSLTALDEAVDVGHVDLESTAEDPDPAVDPVAALRGRACRLLGAWTRAAADAGAGAGHRLVSVGGSPLNIGIVAGTGAIEVAVHGWDVARACGQDRPIPPELAEEMLDLSHLFVADDDRPRHFAAPVAMPRGADPGSRLLAFLGRDPRAAISDPRQAA